MVNINKLKGKIVECGESVDSLAKKTGLNKSTIYRKMADNGDTFTIAEADLISKILNLTKEEVNAIFFAQFVA